MPQRYAATVEPLKVWLKDDGEPYLRPQRTTAAQRLGKSYERRILANLAARFASAQAQAQRLIFLEKPWFAYLHESKRLAYCQLDAMLIDPLSGRVNIIEVKLRHTGISFWQVHNLYLPVVRCWLSDEEHKVQWKFQLCEICRWFDPSTAFPVPLQLRQDVLDCRDDTFSVIVMRPEDA